MPELYIMDNRYRPDEFIQGWTSLIWNDRFNDPGDIELVMPPNSDVNKIKLGTIIGSNFSDRMMYVETIESSISEDGEHLYHIKGESLESILKYRVAWSDLNRIQDDRAWVREGPVRQIARGVLRVGGILPGDSNYWALVPWIVIPRTSNTPQYPSDLPDPDIITVTADEPTTISEYLLPIFKQYQVGFRMHRNMDDPTDQTLYVDAYMGSDRTRDGSQPTPIIFGDRFDNLNSEESIDTIQDSVDGVWAWSRNGSLTGRYWPNMDTPPEKEGFDLRVVPIITEHIEDSTETDMRRFRQQKALEYMRTHRPTYVIDGEISHPPKYVYNRDYYLGDRVEIANMAGRVEKVRVNEQIFVDDEEGFRSYPTFIHDDSMV